MDKREVPGPVAEGYLKRDREVISPSYPRAAPFVMDHGRGAEVWDVDGNRYIDLAAGIAVCSTGHCHPKVVEAIGKQSEQFIHISSDFYHPRWVEFAERLAAVAPFQEPAKVFFGNSGAEAIEAAIKLARYHTGRQHFLAFYGAFHGRTLGALSLTASKPVYRRGFQPLMNGVYHVPYPDSYRPILRDAGGDYGEQVVRFIQDVTLQRLVPPEDVAAILVEPIQGEGGYVVPPPRFFPALRELCDKHGILLIVDEVQSGMGRTGTLWAIEQWGVEPDMVCSAKGIASGLPLGALITRASIMNWPKGAHGNTFGGNPVACAAGLVTLELIQGGMMENAKKVGDFTLDALAEIQARHPSIGDVRGMGLMIGVEFVESRESKAPAAKLRDRVLKHAFARGVLMLGCGQSAIRISPALNIEQSLMEEALVTFEEAISEAEGENHRNVA